ncbi:hypothetical protein [Campylobacter curvus]|uniref:hypothetical protein n=1 Tax=Campylobacter curvus TaxID=200 RepID=UPI0002FA8259|nr:hypothetical protein [Campylobacter curvus]
MASRGICGLFYKELRRTFCRYAKFSSVFKSVDLFAKRFTGLTYYKERHGRE